MSTRSGKRIHSSVYEDTAPPEQEHAVKSERKTRNKRVKENIEEHSISLFKNKKRNNYVSYPTDDEQHADTDTRKEAENKSSRVLRKNALKEQNPLENLETQTGTTNHNRKSRRGKRLPEDGEDIENLEVTAEVKELTKSKKSKKKNKVNAVADVSPSAEEAPAKKSKKKNKKGKKTNSLVVEDIQQNENSKNGTFNKSHMSIDSFHSAAGSPGSTHHDMVEHHINKFKTSFEEDGNEINTMSPTKSNKKGNKNLFIIRDSSCDTNISVTKNNLENLVDNFTKDANVSNGQLQRRKSKIKDTTIEINNVSKSNVDLETDVDSNLNISNVSGKRMSRVKEMALLKNLSLDVNGLINNDTFDKESVLKDITFDKSNASIAKVENGGEIDLNDSKRHTRARRSAVKDTTFEKSNLSIAQEHLKDVETKLNSSITSSKQLKARKSLAKDITFDKSNKSINHEKDAEIDELVLNISNKQLRSSRSSIKNTTFDKPDLVIDTTYEKDTIGEKNRVTKKDTTFDKSNSKNLDATYEKDIESDSTDISNGKRKKKISSVNTSYDKTDKNDDTFDKDISTSFDAFKKGAMTRKSSIKDSTFDKSNASIVSLTKEDFEKDENIISSSAKKRRSIRRQTFEKSDTIAEDDNIIKEKPNNNEIQPQRKSLRISQSPSDIQNKLNTTFEKEVIDVKEQVLKSSLISSDNSNAMDKSDISRISITSDDTTENVEHIVNTTPVLIESSMDESTISKQSVGPQTPLKREGTFTKDGPEIQPETETPTKRKSLIPSAGCTPYHITKSSSKSMLNVTKSIEKGVRASLDPAPRLTRVMFCSPVDNPVMGAQEKRKIIKSNLKGSNKSFVFEESASISRPGRKRSYTQSDADDAQVKRSRLTGDLQQSVDRLSRPRTTSAAAKLTLTPSKKPTTPSKPKSESKSSRVKLPNFAALHQKQFDKMESLDECQERRAKRAKQLLTPKAPPGLLDRISPKSNTEPLKPKEAVKLKEKTDTPTKKLPTLDSLRPGFTRFGFKLNMDVNPFSIPSKTEKKEKVDKPNGGLSRQGTMPSLAGATSVRREAAKQTVMREKSFSEKRNVNRNENRTIIKGVRTNRRFELQMKLRNLD